MTHTKKRKRQKHISSLDLWGANWKVALLFWVTACSVSIQAWESAESPGDCPSSTATSSTSPWADRASRAGGGDPGLRRWGAGRPRRLLQRSGWYTEHAHTEVSPLPPHPQSSVMAAVSDPESPLSPLYPLLFSSILWWKLQWCHFTAQWESSLVVILPFQGCLVLTRSSFLQRLRMP